MQRAALLKCIFYAADAAPPPLDRNPNFFLIYTSSAGTLITFITSKYTSLQDLYKSGLDMIKGMILDVYSKKIGGIMNQFEEEKSKFIAAAGQVVQQGAESVNHLTSAVGLGNVLGDVNKEISQFFQDSSKMKLSDLNPENIKAQQEKFKQKLVQKTKELIVSKFKDFGVPEEISLTFFELIMSEDKGAAITQFAQLIDEKTKNKLPKQFIQWVLEFVFNQRPDNKITLNVQTLLPQIIDIMLNSQLLRIDEQLKASLRNILLKLINCYDVIKRGEFHECLTTVKELLLQLPLKPGEDWQYSPVGVFALKMVDALAQVYSGQGNSAAITQILTDCLEIL